jgi:hypothetical protein
MRTAVKTAAERRTDRLLTALLLALLLALLGIMGSLDYDEARRLECSNSSQGYDPAHDQCLPR